MPRAVAKPAGAATIPLRTCTAGSDTLALFLKVSVFAATSAQTQHANFSQVGALAAREIPNLQQARKAWLKAGYPAGFAAVRDIDREIDALNRLVTIAKAGTISDLPAVYSDLVSARDQYQNDANDKICT